MVGVAKRFTLPGIFSCFCASSLDNIDGSSQPISAPQGRRSIHFSNSAGGSFTGGRGRPPSTSTSRAPAQEGQPSSYALGSSTTSSLASAEGRSSIGLARAESMLLFSYFEEEASSDPHLSETALFIESMLSDMRARACAVTTLDTASSLTRKCCDMWSVTSSNNMFSAYEPDEHNTIPTGKRLSLDNSDKGPDEDRHQQPPNPCRQGVKGPLNAAMEPSPNFTVESEPVLASAATRLSAGEVGQDVVAGYGLLGAAASSVLSAGPCIPAFAKGVTADQDAFPAACGSIKPNRGKGLFLLAVYSQLPAAVTGKVQPDEPKTWSAAFPAFRRDTNDDDAASATMTHPHDAQDSYEPCQVGAAESDVGAPQGQSHLPRSLEDVRLESAAPGKPTATVALVDAAEREGASLMKIQQQLLLQPGQLAVLLPCPLQMLADLGDLTSLARPGALGGAWLGTWHGNQVVVKLTSYPSADAATAQLLATTRASGVRHPNLLNVYDTRAALVDEQTAASLDPIQATALRSGWTDRCRPMGRLQRFLALNMPPLQTPGSTTDSAPSLTVFPGDVVSATGSICIVADAAPPSPAQRALSALPLHPGGCVVAAITEYCDMVRTKRGNQPGTHACTSGFTPTRPRHYPDQPAGASVRSSTGRLVTALQPLPTLSNPHASQPQPPCSLHESGYGIGTRCFTYLIFSSLLAPNTFTCMPRRLCCRATSSPYPAAAPHPSSPAAPGCCT
ncbi:hypothetical protein Agub_g10184 [Astrephomene gubernaculifera]|uniref:Protein kinase domain-containing protein n=1 Tax=Astrephomene gubernaculifera TaxID=47775 RepID=A0AAD3HNU5_9CHLO|nr:hypothetical protein Agub_g10184 [Astrephomene gubernaculifera]